MPNANPLATGNHLVVTMGTPLNEFGLVKGTRRDARYYHRPNSSIINDKKYHKSTINDAGVC